MNGSFSLKKSYLGLLVLIACFSVISFVSKDEWFGAYFSNIAAGIVGSLIIILLVDHIIERNRETDRLQVVRTALRRLHYPILDHMSLLCKIYKAATQSKPTPLPTTFEDTFENSYYKEISFLDFVKDAGLALKMDWFTRLDLETKSFKKTIEQIIDAYANFLDIKLIDILERLIRSAFLRFMPQIRMTPDVDRRYGVKRPHYTMFSGMENILREYVSLMLELVKYYNSQSDSPIHLIQGWWSDIESPKWGSGRV